MRNKKINFYIALLIFAVIIILVIGGYTLRVLKISNNQKNKIEELTLELSNINNSNAIDQEKMELQQKINELNSKIYLQDIELHNMEEKFEIEEMLDDKNLNQKNWREVVLKALAKYIGVEEIPINEGDIEDNHLRTIKALLKSKKTYIENYTDLMNAGSYGIGCGNGGSIIESNYLQYYNLNNEKKYTFKKYEKPINIKAAIINYSIENDYDNENVALDENGYRINYETKIDDLIEYQNNQLKNNSKQYGFMDEENNEEFFFEITGMLIMNGNNESEESFYNNSRAKKIKVTFDNGEEQIIDLKDTMEPQFLDISYKKMDISNPVSLNIEVIETYKGKVNNDIYISDIQVGVISNVPTAI